MKISYANFETLVKYMELKAKGSDLHFSFSAAGNAIEIKVTTSIQDPAVITLYAEDDKGTSFPKIAVTRRLGDEIK